MPQFHGDHFMGFDSCGMTTMNESFRNVVGRSEGAAQQ